MLSRPGAPAGAAGGSPLRAKCSGEGASIGGDGVGEGVEGEEGDPPLHSLQRISAERG